MKFNHVICGDCVDVMSGFPAESIDLVITSPPYDNLRDYKGYSFEYRKIADGLWRIIKSGGVVIWVVQDATIDGSKTLSSMHQAIYFKEIGFNVHDIMIYRKHSVRYCHPNKYSGCWEYMFCFTKDKPKTFNPIRVKNTKWMNMKKKIYKRQKNGAMKVEIGQLGFERNSVNIFTYDAGYNKSTKNGFAFDHPAVFPEALVHDQVITWSNAGDVVLDPMCGSGTTLKVAAELGRRWIGIDVSDEFCEIAKRRVSVAQPFFETMR